MYRHYPVPHRYWLFSRKTQAISKIYIQNITVSGDSAVNMLGMLPSSSIDDDYCASQVSAFGGAGTSEELSGMARIGSVLRRGKVLIFSIWMDAGSGMLWLGGNYPVDANVTKARTVRGPCAVDSGNTTMLKEKFPNARVTWSNGEVGDFGKYPHLSTKNLTVKAEQGGPACNLELDSPSNFQTARVHPFTFACLADYFYNHSFQKHTTFSLNMDSSLAASKKRTAEKSLGEGPTAKKRKIERFMDLLGSEMVDIHVGKGLAAEHFHVHKAILCEKIPYFAGMFGSDFKEAAESKADFPEDDPQSLDLLLEWVYRDRLRELKVVLKSGFLVCNYSVGNLYVLLDKLCLQQLADKLFSKFFEMSIKRRSIPSIASFQTMYHRLPPGCGLLRYLLQWFHYVMAGQPNTKNIVPVWPAEMANQLLLDSPRLSVEYAKLAHNHPIGQVVEDPRAMSPCTFHNHREDEECPVSKLG
ncbi:hypothetical protein VTL71DRAFT_3731 [Oculimacula yallundae]|uniref:Glucanase n=1 Tax=Oculimacula yallundae TaxID=86028 RepID=A0ABR4C5P3_9HELO